MRKNNEELPAATWLHLIENDKLRAQALTNLNKFPGEPWVKCNKINDALFHAFKWEESGEGEFYWLNVYNSNIGINPVALQVNTDRQEFNLYNLTLVSGIVSMVSMIIFKYI